MAQLVFVVALALLTIDASKAGHWSYHSEREWSDQCQNGRQQSPIALSRSIAILKEYHPFSMHGYGQIAVAMMKNNGHSAEVRLETVEAPTVHGGGLPGTYQLDHLHFHWQSEHTMESYRYPLELHLVHFNQLYHNLSNAVQHRHGVAVLGVFFDLSPDDDEHVEPLMDIVDNLKDQLGKAQQLKDVSVKNFLPRDKAGFYRYYGSLTTPECNEGIVWTIFTSTLPISIEQVKIFEKIQTEDNTTLVTNYRSLQALNGRHVYLKQSPMREFNSASVERASAAMLFALGVWVVLGNFEVGCFL